MKEKYTYKVHWSASDEAYIGTVAEFPFLSAVEDSPEKAFSEIINLVGFVIEEMESNGETPPLPIGEITYSGKLSLRMTPEQHRRVAIEAAEQGISINRLLVSRI